MRRLHAPSRTCQCHLSGRTRARQCGRRFPRRDELDTPFPHCWFGSSARAWGCSDLQRTSGRKKIWRAGAYIPSGGAAAGLNDRVFAVEVVIDRARAEVGLGINIAHGGLMETFAGEAAIGRVDDLVPRGTVHFGDLGHRTVTPALYKAVVRFTSKRRSLTMSI